jgi:hypothetical protein
MKHVLLASTAALALLATAVPAMAGTGGIVHLTDQLSGLYAMCMTSNAIIADATCTGASPYGGNYAHDASLVNASNNVASVQPRCNTFCGANGGTLNFPTTVYVQGSTASSSNGTTNPPPPSSLSCADLPSEVSLEFPLPSIPGGSATVGCQTFTCTCN